MSFLKYQRIPSKPYPIFNHQPLKIHAGWRIQFTSLSNDMDPRQVSPDDEDAWLDFMQDLMYIHYDETFGLDLGWYPEGDPNGAFELQLVTHKDFKKLFSIETRSLNEVLDGIDKITWGVSQGILPARDREFSIKELVPPFRLQPLKIYSGWTVRHNTFTETDPIKLPPDRPEMWTSLTEDLLRLENDDHDEIRLGWEPAGDPNGRFVLQVFKDGDKEHPTRTIETRKKEEIVDWIEWATLGRL